MIWSNVSNPFLGQQRRCFQHVFRVRERFGFIRKYSDNGSRSVPLYRTKTGYYDILGLSPSATQAQIKTAFYKKSFIYHPDKNAGCVDATSHFSVINEAYTVLGNKALRKKYDRRLLSLSDLTATTKHPSAKHRDKADGRRSVPGTDYQDVGAHFDKFYKSHYRKQLEKERLFRARREELQRTKEEIYEDEKLEAHVGFGVFLMVGMVVLILSTLG